MTLEKISFELPATTDAERLLADLVGPAGLRVSRPRAIDEMYLDTRDGRLFRHGAALRVSLAEGRGTSICLSWNAVELRAALAKGTPQFVWQIRQEALREPLDALVADRQLRPLVRVRGQRVRLDRDGTQGAARLEVVIERCSVSAPTSSETIELPDRVSLRAGDAEELSRLVAALESTTGVSRAVPRIARALECAGVAIGSPPDPAAALRPGLEATLALRLVHRSLLDRILECRTLAVAAIDVEAVHDLRVAIRRTRAALGLVRGVYPEPERAHFRDEFGWLARATGEARDLDVFAAWLRRYGSTVPERVAAALQPLEARLRRDRTAEQTRLVERLGSERAQRLLAEWERALEISDRSAVAAAASGRIDRLVQARFAKALDKTRRLAAGLGARPAAQEIHRLRLAGKRARYLLELFTPLYPTELVEHLLPAFRALQDALGDYHDAALQERRVLEFSSYLEGDRGNAPTVLALGRLLSDLSHRQSEVLQALPDLLAAITGPTGPARVDTDSG